MVRFFIVLSRIYSIPYSYIICLICFSIVFYYSILIGENTMKRESYFLTLFCIVSFVLIGYGFYTDINTREEIRYYDALGLTISLVSSILGVIFVVCEVLEQKMMFIVSIAASLFMIIYLFFWSPLIWDFMLSLGYLCISIYGLYYCSQGENRHREKVSKIPTQVLSWKEWKRYLIIGVIGTCILSTIGIYVGHYTSSLQAISDAFTTVFSIIGQVLVSRKYLESWYMWILTNAVSVPLYISIGSYTYGALFFCYLLISFYGLFLWKKRM